MRAISITCPNRNPCPGCLDCDEGGHWGCEPGCTECKISLFERSPFVFTFTPLDIPERDSRACENGSYTAACIGNELFVLYGGTKFRVTSYEIQRREALVTYYTWWTIEANEAEKFANKEYMRSMS